MKRTLYEISQEWEDITAELLEAGGECTPELEERLDELYGESDEKVDGYIMVCAELKMLAEGAKIEADRLRSKYQAATNAVKRLGDRLAEHMAARDIDTIERPLGKIRLQQSQPSVELDVAPEELPDEFKRVSVSADKTALKALLKAGDEAAAKYAHLTEPGRFIRIY